MARNVRMRELLLGVEGLALLRRLYDGTDDEAAQRVDEMRRILADETYATGELTAEADARSGYRSWSQQYDEPGNQIIAIEQPVVWSLVDGEPPGYALDVACGTGRHTAHLVALGHHTIGADLSREMLASAAAKVTEATFVEADVQALPVRERAFDLVVCGLALAHVAELREAVSELGRVLRPGGCAVISALHPFQAHLAWHAPYQDEHGNRRFVREHAHTHSDYLDAFRRAGLDVEACVEPALGPDDVRAKRRAYRHVPEATTAAYLGLPAVLVWKVRARS